MTRRTGTSFRGVLHALAAASQNSGIVVYVVRNQHTARLFFEQAVDIAEHYADTIKRGNYSITFPNGGEVRFTNIDNENALKGIRVRSARFDEDNFDDKKVAKILERLDT